MSAYGSNGTDASTSSGEDSLLEQFHAWEIRGRGWLTWDEPVELEPPFAPFFWRPPQTRIVDDGRKHTFVSAFIQRLHDWAHGIAIQPEEPQEEEDEFPPEEWIDPDSFVELELCLPPNVSVSKASTEQFLLSLSLCRHPISFEVIGLPDTTLIQIVAADADSSQVRRQVEAHFPDATLTEGGGILAREWMTLDDTETVVAEFGLSREFMLPLACPSNLNTDPLAGIVGALADVATDEIALLQILFRPVRHPWAESILRSMSSADWSAVSVGAKPFAALSWLR